MCIKNILFCLLLISSFCSGQNLSGVGTKIGAGNIKGNSIGVTSYYLSFFVDIPTPFTKKIKPRLGFVYAKDIESISPDNSFAYHSFLKGFTFGASTYQLLDNKFYIEESLGFLALNDRIFLNSSEWNYGIVFSLLGGLDLRKNKKNGIKIGVGFENGFTFTKSLSKYYSFYFQLQLIM